MKGFGQRNAGLPYISKGSIKLGSTNFISPYGNVGAVINYANIGDNNSIQNSGQHFMPLIIDMTLATTANGKVQANILNRMSVTDTSSTGSTIMAQFNIVDVRPSSGNSTIYGSYNFVNGDGLAASLVGGVFSCAHGSPSVSGLPFIAALQAFCGMSHGGSTTNAYGIEVHMYSSAGFTGTVTKGVGLYIRTTIQDVITVTEFRGISFDGWVKNGTVPTSYGIYADTSIDIGTTNRYFIYSTSTSPSRFAGDIEVTDSTKGIILRASNGNRYRLVVSTAGALSTTLVP